MKYKGFIIDTSSIYGGKVSINICGDDVLFDDIEEAKMYIDNCLK